MGVYDPQNNNALDEKKLDQNEQELLKEFCAKSLKNSKKSGG